MNYRLHMGVNMSTFQKLIIFSLLSITTSIFSVHRRGQRYVEKVVLSSDLKPALKKTVTTSSPISQTISPRIITSEKKQGSQEIIRSGLSSNDEEEISGEASLLKAGLSKTGSVLKAIAPAALVMAGSCLSSNLYGKAQAVSSRDGTPLSPTFLIPAAASVVTSCLADGILTENATLESVAKNIIPRIIFAAPAGVAMNQFSGVTDSVKTAWGFVSDKTKREETMKSFVEKIVRQALDTTADVLLKEKDPISTKFGNALQKVAAETLSSPETKDKLSTLATTTLSTALENPGIKAQIIKPIGEALSAAANSGATPGFFSPLRRLLVWGAERIGKGMTTSATAT